MKRRQKTTSAAVAKAARSLASAADTIVAGHHGAEPRGGTRARRGAVQLMRRRRRGLSSLVSVSKLLFMHALRAQAKQHLERGREDHKQARGMAPYISVVSSAAPDAESPNRGASKSGSKSSTPSSTPNSKRRDNTLWTPPSPQTPQAQRTARTNSLTSPPSTPRTSEHRSQSARHPWTPPSRPSVHRLSFDSKMLSSSINQQFAVKKPAKALEHIPFAEQFIPPGRFRHRHMDAILPRTRIEAADAREQPFAGLSGPADVAIEAMRYRRGRCHAAPGSIKDPEWTSRQVPRAWAPEKALKPWPAPYEPFEPSFGSGESSGFPGALPDAPSDFLPWASDDAKVSDDMVTAWA